MARTLVVWSLILGTATGWAWLEWKGLPPAAERVAAQRVALVPVTPVLGGLLLTGLLAGLWRRERTRWSDAHYSPALAWIGKRAWLASVVAVGVWTLGPVSAEAAWLYAAGLGLAAGAGLYAGNLPPKL